MKELFASNIFLVFYGVIFYYVILWSMAKNKKSKELQARLKLADSKAMRAVVVADPQYRFHMKEWFDDNLDEMVISVMSSMLLISFDTLFADLINRKFFADDPIELGKAVYLLGGVVGDMIYRAISKMRNG